MLANLLWLRIFLFQDHSSRNFDIAPNLFAVPRKLRKVKSRNNVTAPFYDTKFSNIALVLRCHYDVIHDNLLTKYLYVRMRTSECEFGLNQDPEAVFFKTGLAKPAWVQA